MPILYKLPDGHYLDLCQLYMVGPTLIGWNGRNLRCKAYLIFGETLEINLSWEKEPEKYPIPDQFQQEPDERGKEIVAIGEKNYKELIDHWSCVDDAIDFKWRKGRNENSY